MVEIGLYLLKALPWKTSVSHTTPFHFWHQIMCHVRRSLILLSDECKQDTATTAEHSKRVIGMLQNITVLFADMSNIWKNTDGCADQY